LPVGIPQFANARDQVATGLRPGLDGVEWLRENRYRTVLHIHRPGEEDAADRRLFELRGLRFLSLEVGPLTLSPLVIENFAKTVSDTPSYPLFVYDRDGSLAGPLWYLGFRVQDHRSDEEARTLAARLGLRIDLGGEHRTMWLAVQKYLSEQPR
jgi:hypothetical protein